MMIFEKLEQIVFDRFVLHNRLGVPDSWEFLKGLSLNVKKTVFSKDLYLSFSGVFFGFCLFRVSFSGVFFGCFLKTFIA
jgi:hypothetical protein